MHQKSLLSRIRTQDARYQGAALEDVLEQVFSNIDGLLNSRQGSAGIAEDYGMPDFNSVIHHAEETMITLETGIKKMLEKYEKRLSVSQVVGVIDSKALPGEVTFQISGFVPYEDQKHFIEYQTVITGSGKTVIAR